MIMLSGKSCGEDGLKYFGPQWLFNSINFFYLNDHIGVCSNKDNQKETKGFINNHLTTEIRKILQKMDKDLRSDKPPKY